MRLFAQWLSSIDPAHEVPPRGLLPDRSGRSRPYIYSEAEIASIIAAAKALPSIYGLRGLTCSTLFGLIAVTGLRISEALALDCGDLDVENGVLRVRRGKLGKERLLPLDPTVVAQLVDYAAERDRLLGRTPDAFFVTGSGTRLTDCSARYNFAHACQQIGLRDAAALLPAWPGTAHPRPSPHLRCADDDQLVPDRQGPGARDDQADDLSGPYRPRQHVLVSGGGARAARSGDGTGNLQRRGGGPMSAVTLPALIQRFFTDRLCVQMEASRHTVAGYRDTFRLLLRFASARHGKPPVKLTVEDIDADLVADFLVHGETARGNSARSRNTRLAAIRSFFRYVAMTDPTRLLHCQRILAMPNKRYVKRAVTFLDADEIAALLAAPDRTTWAGRRDHALLLLAIQTGLRASELVNLRCNDVVLGSGAHIRCMGKGRKERCTPLRRDTARLLAAWIGDRPDGSSPLFPSIRGEKLSRDALEHLVRKHCLTASRACPSIGTKRVTPHTLRHSTAMDLLHHGVDQAVIALWLGHESVATTQVYIHADMRMKERALARVAAPATPTGRFQPDDQLLAFLEGL